LILIKIGKRKFKSNNLCLAGGVAMNCVMNSKILESGLIQDIFIQPLAGDNGSMIGSAMLKYVEKTGRNDFEEMRHLYYGTKYSNSYIEKMLKSKGLRFEYLKEPYKQAAKLIAEDKVIGWFNGKMEAGARALGNRSILSNPTKKKNKERMNTIKYREQWRPLAVSILDEYKHKYLQGYIPNCADFMIIARYIQNNMQDKIPAALHVDNSTRPQVVKKDVNESYYNLIKEFYKITGIPLVMNTSMNGRGEPIVENPEQALNLFNNTELDALFLENYFILKTNSYEVNKRCSIMERSKENYSRWNTITIKTFRDVFARTLAFLF